jgi:hypothetical protein
MAKLAEIETALRQAPDQQIPLTDPHARSMATSGRGTGIVGYNVQAVVDTKHHMIVAHDVVNVGHGRTQLASMASCAREGTTTLIPKPLTWNSKAEGRFHKRDFLYIQKRDEYRCPVGERAIWRMTTVEKGLDLHRYWPSACPTCRMKDRCNPGDYRRIARWEHEHVLDDMQRGLDRMPEAARLRRHTVEHTFRTLKAWMGFTHFLTKTLGRARTEMSLHVLAYNLKRALQIFGTQTLVAFIRA